MKTLDIEVHLRPKNQLTLPELIARHLGAEPGARLIFEVNEDLPGIVQVRRLLDSYAGVADGVYGTEEEVAEYLRGERMSWGE